MFLASEKVSDSDICFILVLFFIVIGHLFWQDEACRRRILNKSNLFKNYNQLKCELFTSWGKTSLFFINTKIQKLRVLF